MTDDATTTRALATDGALAAVWGGERGRTTLADPRVLLGGDASRLYVLGCRGHAIWLETWSVEAGEPVASRQVTPGRIISDAVWRHGGQPHPGLDDEILCAVSDAEGEWVVSIDLRTAALVRRGTLDLGDQLVAVAPDGEATRVVHDRDGATWVESILPREAGIRLAAPRPCALDGFGDVVCGIGDGARLTVWQVGRSARHGGGEVLAVDESATEGMPRQVAHGGTKVWSLVEAELRCWDYATGDVRRWEGVPPDAEIVAAEWFGAAVLLDGPVAFAIDRDAAVAPGGYDWAPGSARLSLDGRRLAHRAAALGWSDLATGRRYELHEGGHSARVTALAASPDGRRVASSALDRTIRVRDVATGREEWALEGDAAGYESLAFAPDGATLYAVHGRESWLTAWSLRDGAEVTPARLPLGVVQREWRRGAGIRDGDAGGAREPGEATRVEVSGDGALLLVIVRDPSTGRRRPVLVDLARFAAVGAPLAYYPELAFAAFAGEGRGVVALQFFGEGPGFDACFWPLTYDPSSGRRPRAHASARAAWDPWWEPAGGFLRGGRFAAVVGGRRLTRDGEWLPACVTFHEVALDGAADEVRPGEAIALPVDALRTAVAVGGRGVAVATAAGEVALAERATGRAWRVADAGGAPVTALAFAPGDGALYAGTENGQVRVYRCPW